MTVKEIAGSIVSIQGQFRREIDVPAQAYEFGSGFLLFQILEIWPEEKSCQTPDPSI